jgi:hypothetical protein
MGNPCFWSRGHRLTEIAIGVEPHLWKVKTAAMIKLNSCRLPSYPIDNLRKMILTKEAHEFCHLRNTKVFKEKSA